MLQIFSQRPLMLADLTFWLLALDYLIFIDVFVRVMIDEAGFGAARQKTEENAEFHQIVDFLTTSSIHYALTASPTIYASYIEQFWNTANSQTVNGVKQIHAIVDGKTVVISESSVMSDLHFNYEDGITCLTNIAIFENLELIGYESDSEKHTFQKALFSP
ncbi:hypothetical protein Tco_0891334 [Tanacetum coccineum]|uniref:Xylulose kinase-1 n=1 Tax=Tanacetum coccineum TaxID=301880 RepID=A0ABQ5C4P7_9ASTR